MVDAPDQTQALLQMQSMIASSRGNAGGAPILAGILPSGGRDINMGQGLSTQGGGLKADATFRMNAQAKPGIFESLKQQLGLKGGQILDDIKKCGQNASVVYSGDMPSGSLPGTGGNGGSFVASLGARDGGGIDL